LWQGCGTHSNERAVQTVCCARAGQLDSYSCYGDCELRQANVWYDMQHLLCDDCNASSLQHRLLC
jgi:hypothetical protein